MLRSQSLNLFLGYSLGIITCMMMSCSNGPKVRVHISDPQANGMEFFDQKTKTSGFVPYSQTVNFVCFNPADTQTLLTYCGVK